MKIKNFVDKKTKSKKFFLLEFDVLGLLAVLPPPVVRGSDEGHSDGRTDEVPRVGHEFFVSGDLGVLLLDRFSTTDKVGGVADEFDLGPDVVHGVLVFFGHLLGGHVRSELLDFVLILRDDPVGTVEVDVGGEHGGGNTVLAGDLVGHELLGDFVEADFSGSADLHAEDVFAVRSEDLILFLVDELLSEGVVVVSEGSSLSTEDSGRTFEGCGTESHSCTSHVEEGVMFLKNSF